MTKQVTMPDGHVIYNVPEDVKDEDVINKYLDKKLKIEDPDLPEKTDDEVVVEETTEQCLLTKMNPSQNLLIKKLLKKSKKKLRN